MIIIHAIFQVDPAKQQAFLEEIQPLIHGSREESENVSYNLYKDTEKESVYTMVEVWKDEAAVASHNTSEHFTSFVSKAAQFLTAPLDIKAYNGELVK
ncbi:putative quinol monooxygenase [Bacillus toyonensis]|uniref:putative quinol monooxygenase n=1 Tax=Bacillus toyonensis TaxID=155322 RepID=UPI00032E39D2|nr:putative quinol monooxygenase [Bacillus toyonensis]EOP26571.1 cytoplasmic protein [Bacillus toyonensis]OQD29830.1 putative monooxygenase YcnE [Bacillus toyonensis]WIG25404.1 putative quinol monooxygenase [Bacillus toyonensis]WIG34617.1 putative quinol monooxygenase [Bacillus toyonensis]WIG39730.1 putative quinol monooxygenase [Bacillus toyonensis]